MFNQYPYLNLNDLNLDYLLNEIKSMYNDVTNFVSINAIKYADPIQWNITSQYEKNTVVIDPLTGTAYISVAPVPSGVALTRTEYWTVVFDLGSFVTRAAQNFTSHWESDTTTTATFSTSTGEWLVWGDVLYKALTNITAGDSYVVGGNIEHFTVEDLYNAYLNTIAQILAKIGDLVDLTTTDKSSIVAAINEVITTFTDAITTEAQTRLETTRKVYNLKEHGADNTGVSDCSALLNDAIANNEGIIYIPEGVYLISEQINVNVDNIEIYGAGKNTILLINCNNAIYLDGYYINLHDISFKPNNNGFTAIVIYDSFDNLNNVYFADTNNYYFDNCIILGTSDHISWGCKLSNIRINQATFLGEIGRGSGIRYAQAVNTILTDCFIANKDYAIPINGGLSDSLTNEGFHFDNINIVWCNFGIFAYKVLALFINEIIIDQTNKTACTFYNSNDIVIDNSYLATRPTSTSFRAILFNNCAYGYVTNTQCGGVSATDTSDLIALFSSIAIHITNDNLLLANKAIIFGDMHNKRCWCDALEFYSVNTKIEMRGANQNNSYGKLFGAGNLSLNDIATQRATTYTAIQFINIQNATAPYYDIEYNITDTIETAAPYNVGVTIIGGDGLTFPLIVHYMHDLSTANKLVFRVYNPDNTTNIPNCWFSLSIYYWKY